MTLQHKKSIVVFYQVRMLIASDSGVSIFFWGGDGEGVGEGRDRGTGAPVRPEYCR